MDSTFGTRLRLQREEQQIPLATIAEQTKIKLSLLEGLERDDVSRWPTGIFRRSYFRAYARAIGLEPDRMLREFQALYPDPERERGHHRGTGPVAADNGQPRRPPTRLRCLIDSAVNALPALHLQPNFKSAPSGSGRVRMPPCRRADRLWWLRRRSFVPTPVLSGDPRRAGVDLAAVAQLCTRLARALDVCDMTPVLEEAARVLGAVGLILWVRDRLRMRVDPGLRSWVFERDDGAARLACRVIRTTRSRGRSGRPKRESSTEATWRRAPSSCRLLTPTGCAGVLALELRNGGERLECVRAAATILAAQLSTLVGAPVLAEAVGA